MTRQYGIYYVCHIFTPYYLYLCNIFVRSIFVQIHFFCPVMVHNSDSVTLGGDVTKISSCWEIQQIGEE